MGTKVLLRGVRLWDIFSPNPLAILRISYVWLRVFLMTYIELLGLCSCTDRPSIFYLVKVYDEQVGTARDGRRRRYSHVLQITLVMHDIRALSILTHVMRYWPSQIYVNQERRSLVNEVGIVLVTIHVKLRCWRAIDGCPLEICSSQFLLRKCLKWVKRSQYHYLEWA